MPPPPSMGTRIKSLAKAATGVAAVMPLLLLGIERVDPVEPSPTPINCESPGHDLEVSRETRENPLLALERFDPPLGIKLKLLPPDAFQLKSGDACPQDERNVDTMIGEMKTTGELRPWRHTGTQ